MWSILSTTPSGVAEQVVLNQRTFQPKNHLISKYTKPKEIVIEAKSEWILPPNTFLVLKFQNQTTHLLFSSNWIIEKYYYTPKFHNGSSYFMDIASVILHTWIHLIDFNHTIKFIIISI